MNNHDRTLHIHESLGRHEIPHWGFSIATHVENPGLSVPFIADWASQYLPVVLISGQ